MLGNSRVKILLLFFLVAGNFRKSAQDRCGPDAECRNVETCDEIKFFISRNEAEIRKLKVCGWEANTIDFCCKIDTETTVGPPSRIKVSDALSTHRNINLINHAKCGRANTIRITGGTVAKVGALPWMALLQYQSKFGEKSFKCGGSLISPKYVLTAAHCLRVPRYTLISVRLGEHTISTERDCDNPNDPDTCLKDDPPFQDIEIERPIVHEDYVERLRNDIAMLRLKTPAILGPKISGVSTICLPVKLSQTIEKVIEEEPDLTEVNIAGWGYTEQEQSRNSDVLRQASLPFISNDQCMASLEDLQSRTSRKLSIEISEGIMCAGGHNKTDACNGDSGGPLTSPAQNDKEIYKFFQQGIVSRGVLCSSSEVSPGIYTRVFHHMKWILDHLED